MSTETPEAAQFKAEIQHLRQALRDTEPLHRLEDRRSHVARVLQQRPMALSVSLDECREILIREIQNKGITAPNWFELLEKAMTSAGLELSPTGDVRRVTAAEGAQ